MELKSTALGRHLAQHPYNRVRMLNAGVEVSGDRHEYVLPFNQLLDIHCKRGLVWGELEFELAAGKVVRLHGTEWQETQAFYRYLIKSWQAWSEEMSLVSAEVLQKQANEIHTLEQQDDWFDRKALERLQQNIRATLASLPLPVARLESFEICRDNYQLCRQWLDHGAGKRTECNQQWMERTLVSQQEFFLSVEATALNVAQCKAVMNGEDAVLVLAGAGSGKTSVLVARAAWLMHRGDAVPEQILLLAFGRKAAEEMNERIHARLHTEDIQAKTFHALALHIIEQSSRKIPQISQLESNGKKRRELLIRNWQQQCAEKKTQAKGWRQWLTEELAWPIPEGDFWRDPALAERLAGRLERWIGLMRMHGGSQSEMIEQAPEALRPSFQQRIRLMSPLLKAWKKALKDENAVDFSGLIHQAVNLLDNGRFISPWKHILVDEFQDISPQRARLLSALRRQNSRTCLFAVGDDWQAIYRFSGAELSLTTAFEQNFGVSEQCALDTTYRFNERIGEIANQFIQQNPYQLKKPLNSLSKGDKKAVTILSQEQLEPLLDKLSGFVKPDERVLLLARYHHLRPEVLQKAATKWPNLPIDFMTVHASKGQQAEYVIIVGLHDGKDGFPAPARESVLEQVLLPETEDFPDAEERRLLYVALTRARHRVWLLQDSKNPSVFIEQLRKLGVPSQRKP
ncbi:MULTISPECIES: DNA helicase IV [Brenneria]|uniref:DNA 3'-5' helicase n=1 Tax=Brenneria nigrifluens DSM 30175 = ATCC 13028 TaxID=1121120 RepID=A0A2U1UJX4_9GAMM|nr:MULTISPECIES: DNA helicase IV [Brenneria]EHD20996.1 UvrD/REP helicase [Brenneria sp. EniD312]PWC21953.1 DNA helicase IV [Brenneria nigrifluens] [Brenneria nigrifluens DSM 30175 = ATCC 13028]QCR04153.1 DNA helicase IV [Brenneria nigrifluens] [Brenneria nigrifluens DSM 30175 = ATCC 13028]